MTTLTPFWQFIESRSGPLAVAREWRDQLGEIHGVASQFLRPTGQKATSYPHPDPRMPPLRVVRHRDGSVVAVDTDDPEVRVELTDADLVLHEVNWRSLRAAIAKALGLEVSRASSTPDGNVLHVGVWRPKRAATYPVVLICCTDHAPLQKAVIGLTLDAGKPTMILTPTRGLWTDELEGFCQQRKCVLVPLDEVIDVTDTGLAAGAAWQGFLDAFAVHGEIKPRGNFSNRPKPKRAARAAKIEALKKVLVQHIRVARDHAYSLKQAACEPMLLPRPSKGQLAKSAGVKDFHISKCFDDDPQLPVLWDIAGDLDQVMKFGR